APSISGLAFMALPQDQLLGTPALRRLTAARKLRARPCPSPRRRRRSAGTRPRAPPRRVVPAGERSAQACSLSFAIRREKIAASLSQRRLRLNTADAFKSRNG